MIMETILKTEKLEKKYGDFAVLNGVDIHIEKGSIYGLIGKNGTGKTTLFRIICGLQGPTSGSYTIYGVNNKKDMSEVRKRMGAIIEKPSIYGDMTAKDNMIEQYKLAGIPDIEGIDELLKLVGLENTGKKKTKHFSLGMKQRLGIALSLAGNPDFLILDEPINGLDPQGIIEIRELILKLNKERRITILISSHYLDELSKIATHYGFLDRGTIVEEISSEELAKHMEHKIEMRVSDPKAFVMYFEKKGITYEVLNDKTINVYGKYNLSSLVGELAKKNFAIDEIHEVDESLENYYMNLIGGGKID